MLGGVSLVLGAFPELGGLAVSAFLVVATPTMHAFRSIDDPQTQPAELSQFPKNVALAGVLVFFAIGAAAWPLSLNVGF